MIVSGTFLADGNALNIDIGFIPDYVEAFELTSTAEVVYRFYRCLADAEAAGQYGIEDSGAGVLSACATAAAGFAPYDQSKYSYVLLPDPADDKLRPVPVYGDYDATADYSSVGTDRSVTAIGTVIRPTTHNGCVYELITGVTTASTEPAWGTVPGELTLDAGLNVWMCRAENIFKGAGRGFTIGVDLSVNTDLWVFKAERHDRMGDLGDAADGDPITFP